MSVIRAVMVGVWASLSIVWWFYIFAWLVSGPENWPTWANWLNVIALVVTMVVQLEVMSYYFASPKHGGKQ